MQIATKIKVWATVVGAAAILLLYYGATDPSLRTREEGDHQVTLQVVFEEDRSNPDIIVQLSNTPPVPYPAGGIGNWETVLKVAPGTRVILTVSQNSGGTTECHIISRSANASQQMTGPGTISCQLRVS